jgi:putative transposase
MWTQRHRARRAAHLKRVVLWHAVREVAGWLERADPPQSENATPILPVVRAIAWYLRVGGGWRSMPSGMLPWRTVYGWFRRWAALGLFERMMRDVTRLRRLAVGRRPSPHLAIIDAQIVKCLSVRRPRGYDAAKRLVGRKRVAMVDADANWLAVVVPASVQERDTLPALDQDKTAWPSLRAAILDGAFTAERCRLWSNLHGMRHEIVPRIPGQKGFAVLPRRWVIERSFGWLIHWSGLLRDRAGRLDVAAARIACAAVLAATEALINPA